MRKSWAAGSREQFGAGQRLGTRTREDAPPEDGPGALAISAFHCAFNRAAPAWQVTISRAIGVAPVPTAACLVANSNMRAGEAPADGVPPAVTSPQISVDLAQIVGRDMAEQQGVEHALPGIVADIPCKHRVGDFQAGRRGGEPRPEDQPVALVGEIVRQGEGLFGEAGQPVADL